VRRSPPPCAPRDRWGVVRPPPGRSSASLHPKWVPNSDGDGSSRLPPEAADAQRPGGVDRRASFATLRFGLGTDLRDRSGAEEELSKVGIEGRVTAPQPFQGHGRVLLLVVSVVGQDGREALVRRGPDSLVVPIDRLELLAYRCHGSVAVESRRIEQFERFVES